MNEEEFEVASTRDRVYFFLLRFGASTRRAVQFGLAERYDSVCIATRSLERDGLVAKITQHGAAPRFHARRLQRRNES